MKTKLFKIVFFLLIMSTLFVSSAFAIWVQPTSYNFGTYETSLTVTLTCSFPSGYDIHWGVESKPSWIDCPSGGTFPCPGGGPQPVQVEVTVNRAGLTPGQTYSGIIRFYDEFIGTTCYADLYVTMRVPLLPVLSVSPTSYDFGESGTSCQFAVQNTGESMLNWSASEGISWLSLSSYGGSLGPGALQFVAATVNRGGLNPVTYNGTISFTSNGGNKSVTVSMTVPDTTPPTGTISINNNAQYTTSASVTLTLSASDSGSGVSKMRFNNDGGSWSSEENYATAKSWTLTPSDGTKTVYVQYKDNAGNWSDSVSDTIVLQTVVDYTPPTGTILIDNDDNYTNSTLATLTLSASDLSGVSKMIFSNDGVKWSDPPDDYGESKSWTLSSGDGLKVVHVRYMDNVGNWNNSPGFTDTIILDTTGPGGTILINSGDKYTNSTSVTLTLSASDPDSPGSPSSPGSGVSTMRFRNEGGSWSSEEQYNTSKSWTVTSDDGTKTVYVQYKDNVGNWSGAIDDTIILDTTPPTGSILINNGDAYTKFTSVTLSLWVSDSSGVSKMKFKNEGGSWSNEENYATTKSWTLIPGDGEKTVYVQYKDNSGKWSDSISDTIILDTTPPTGSILINGGAEYTNSTSVTLTLSASDSGSGVSRMKFSNDGSNWSGEENYAPSRSWTLPSGDGTKTVYVKYKDNAGNWSNSITDTIILSSDTTPPTGTISINGGAYYTNITSVILTLSASDLSGVSKMRFSNDAVIWSIEEDSATSKSWTLAPGDGTKIVYVQYKDNADNWSGLTAITDTIILDTTAPSGTISIDGAEYTSTTSVTLTLWASDSGSGVSKMRFRNDEENWGGEENYAPSRSWTLTTGEGLKRVYVQYKDKSGRWSSSISDTITLDTGPPTGGISINSGSEYTDSTSATLTLWASDSSGVSKMRFSNDGENWGGEEDYGTSKSSWTLAPGDGLKRVYVQYKDKSGRWSSSISDTITLDTARPTGSILINGGAEYTKSKSVTLTLSAEDSGSGVSKMEFSNDGVVWSNEEDYGKSKPWTLIPGDGPKTVYVQYMDRSGKWSASISDTIILDTVSPTVELIIDKSRIVHDGEIVGVLPDTGMEAKFSEVMRKEAVEEGLELIVVSDNLNKTINEKVPLNFEWNSSTKTARLNPQSGELKKNYLYRLQVTDTVTDLAGNTIKGNRKIIFRTIMDYTKENVVAKVTGEEVTHLEIHLKANALIEDGYLIINMEPLSYQYDVNLNPEDIKVANEKIMSNRWCPVEGCLWEIKVYNILGEWIENNFRSEVKISFPYEEKKGVVWEETLLAFWLNEEHSNWVRVPGSRVDKDKNVVVTGEVPNFSVFALMGTAVYDLSEAHAYPVPWKPNDGKDETGTEQGGITFTNLSAEGVIKIYTISGELVREYEYKPGDEGKWTWDVKTTNGEKVFSGVYIYYIKNEKERKTGRLMIIR